MSREEELKNLYAVITYIWKVLKETDYRTMTDAKWEEIIADAQKKCEDIHKIDVPIGKLFQIFNYCIYDYLNPSLRDRWEREYKDLH